MDSWEIMMMANLSNNANKQYDFVFYYFVETISYLLKFYWAHIAKINTFAIIYLIIKTIAKLNAIVLEIKNLNSSLNYKNKLVDLITEEFWGENIQDEKETNEIFDEKISDKKIVKKANKKRTNSNKYPYKSKYHTKKINRAPIFNMLTDTESNHSDSNDTETNSEIDNSVHNNLREDNIIEGMPILYSDTIVKGIPIISND